MNYYKAIIHLLICLHYYISIWYDQTYVELPGGERTKKHFALLKGRIIYLTYWNFLIQAEYYTICFLNDILGNNDNAPRNPSRLRRLQDLIFSAIAFPLSMFVGLTFWMLYAIDRELVFPKALDAFFPTWLNHAMHTNIMVFLFLELYIQFRRYPSWKMGLGILLGIKVMYLIWIHVIYSYSGMWVYPVLEILQLPGRVVFFVVLFALDVLLYAIGDKLNTLVWRKQLISTKSSRRKRADKSK